MNLSKLWTAWPVAGPWSLSPLLGGTNNRVWRAEAKDGQLYVLRLFPERVSIPHLRYEVALLRALSNTHPPFRLPLPLQAHDGDIMVPFEQETGALAFATLSALLPGRLQTRLERNDPREAPKVACTLASLDGALARLPEIHESAGFQKTFGQLAGWHRLVPDPLVAVERLPLHHDQARQIRRYLTLVIEKVSDLYRHLPQQVLHRDYDPSNILVDEQKVTAVLDFEFAAPDLRVLDVGGALSRWPAHLMGTGKEWDLIDAFGMAYLSRFPLSEEELLVLPDIFRLRDAVWLVDRMGRYLAGLATDHFIQDRVQRSLWLEAWVSTQQETLVQHALAWGRGEKH